MELIRVVIGGISGFEKIGAVADLHFDFALQDVKEFLPSVGRELFYVCGHQGNDKGSISRLALSGAKDS